MGVSNAPTAKGTESARGLKQATMQEEQKIEAKGSDLKKGEQRFEERSTLDKLRWKERGNQAALSIRHLQRSFQRMRTG